MTFITWLVETLLLPSSFLDCLRKKGSVILYMVDRIDEYAVLRLHEFDGVTFKLTTFGESCH